MPAAIHHDPPCPTLNAHRVTDGLGRELWAVRCVEKGEQVEGTEEWSHDCVVLSPENKEYPPITLEMKSNDDLRVFGELVLVLA